ncbi:MAG TPA: hypothetical protein VFF06_16515 [Polyangia bacterium]|nr:hypothetical protein [Polyangia bacterium]
MRDSRWAVPQASVLGDCVSCAEPALAYTGATMTSDHKYLCARCTLARKVVVKPKAAPLGVPRATRRDDPEPPPVNAAKWLQLGDNRFALVDAADYRRANAKVWFLFGGHAVRREQWGGKLRHDYLQRFVLGLHANDAPAGDIEFVDGDPLNCRKANLRVAAKSRA